MEQHILEFLPGRLIHPPAVGRRAGDKLLLPVGGVQGGHHLPQEVLLIPTEHFRGGDHVAVVRSLAQPQHILQLFVRQVIDKPRGVARRLLEVADGGIQESVPFRRVCKQLFLLDLFLRLFVRVEPPVGVHAVHNDLRLDLRVRLIDAVQEQILELVIRQPRQAVIGQGGIGRSRRAQRAQKGVLKRLNAGKGRAVRVHAHSHAWVGNRGPAGDKVQIEDLVHGVGSCLAVKAHRRQPGGLGQGGVGVGGEATALPPVVFRDAGRGLIAAAGEEEVLHLLRQVRGALGSDGVQILVGQAAARLAHDLHDPGAQVGIALVGEGHAVDLRAQLQPLQGGGVQLAQGVDGQRLHRPVHLHAVPGPVGVGEQVHNVADALGLGGGVGLGDPPVVAHHVRVGGVGDLVRGRNGLAHQLVGVNKQILQLVNIQGVLSRGQLPQAAVQAQKVVHVVHKAQHLQRQLQGGLKLLHAGKAAARGGAAEIDLVIDGGDPLGQEGVQLGGVGVVAGPPGVRRLHQPLVGEPRLAAVLPPIILFLEDLLRGLVVSRRLDQSVLDLLPGDSLPHVHHRLGVGEVIMGAEGGQRLEPGGLELRQGGKGVVVLLRLLLAEPPHILWSFVPGGGRVADQFCQSVGQVLLRHGVQGVGHIP